MRVLSDAFPKDTFTGKITAIDPAIDPTSRNFMAEATVANPQKLLLPGMFARVAVLAGAEQHYLTLPQTAITYNPYGSTVFLSRQGRERQADRAAGVRDHGSDARRPGRDPVRASRRGRRWSPAGS